MLCSALNNNSLIDKKKKSIEGYRSNPVLAVKHSFCVEIRFPRSIFFETPARYVHWASNATLDIPVACQMTKLEKIKA